MSPRPDSLATRRNDRLPKVGGRVLHDLARDRVQAQLEQADGLDAKIASLLGFGAGLLGIAIAVLALGDTHIPNVSYVLLAVGAVFYIGMVALGLRGFNLRDFDHGPLLERAWANAHDGLDEERLYAWAAETYTEAYYNNEVCIKPKVHAVSVGLRLLLLEFAVLAVAVLALSLA